MGALGSDAAIEASDIVIMTDEIGKVATGIKIAKNTKNSHQNIVFALGVKLIVLILGFWCCNYVGGSICRCWSFNYCYIKFYEC